MAIKRKTIKRRNQKRRFKRRLYKRKRFNVGQKAMVNLGFGMPKIIKMRHRYFENVALVTTVAGIPSFYRFRANGLVDPNQTGTGHQPTLFSVMKNYYNHFKVIGAKISVTFIPTSSGTVPQYVGIMADDDTSSSIDINTLNEQPDTRRKQIAFNNARPITITHNYSAKKVYGGSIMGNTRLEGDASNDPTEQFYFTIYNCSVDGVNNVGVSALVTIDYIAVWTEAKDLP